MKTLLTAVAFVAAAGICHAGTITFDGHANGKFLSGPVDFGDGLTGSVAATGGKSLAQVFDTSSTANKGQPDFVKPKSAAAGSVYTGGNALMVANLTSTTKRPASAGKGGTLSLTFDRMLTVFGFTGIDLDCIKDTVRVSMDDGPFSSGFWSGNHTFADFTFAKPLTGTKLTFAFSGTGAIDTIRWAEPEVTSAPVPAAGILLLAGLGGLAAVRRRAA